MLEVDALLSRLRLGSFAPLDQSVSLPGHNQTYADTASLGHRIVVKRFRGSAADAGPRLRRSVTFERVVAAGTAPRWFITPSCAGWDENAALMAFELVAGARSGADLLAVGQWNDGLAGQAGLAIGELHAMRPSGAADSPWAAVDRTVPPLPSAALMTGLPVQVYAACSAAELQAWGLLQHDQALAGAMTELLRLQAEAAVTPAHCDFRLEQMFVAEDRLHLCDWEEFRIADPARDVGSFAGEWLHHAVMNVAASDAGAEPLSRGEIIRRIADRIEQLRPRIAAFWAGYRSANPSAGQDLALRATAFAGWHMFDRIFAVARRSARAARGGPGRCRHGRTILLSPATSVQTLGLAS